MNESPTINIKALLIGLVGDAVFDFGAKHHLVAAHEIEHDVLKGRFESLGVDKVEVDQVISGDLDSLISFDEVNESSDFKLIVLFPQLDTWIILVFKDLKEEDLAGAPCNESLIVNEVHLAQINISHLLVLDIARIVGIDG